MLDKLRGIRTPAWVVGALRGILEVVVFAALYATVGAVADAPIPDQYGWVKLLIGAPFFIRTAEGIIDQIDPEKARRRQAADESSIRRGV